MIWSFWEPEIIWSLSRVKSIFHISLKLIIAFSGKIVTGLKKLKFLSFYQALWIQKNDIVYYGPQSWNTPPLVNQNHIKDIIYMTTNIKKEELTESSLTSKPPPPEELRDALWYTYKQVPPESATRSHSLTASLPKENFPLYFIFFRKIISSNTFIWKKT